MAKITSIVTNFDHIVVGKKFNGKIVSAIEYMPSNHSGLGVTAAKTVARDYWKISTEVDGKKTEIGRTYTLEARVTYGE